MTYSVHNGQSGNINNIKLHLKRQLFSRIVQLLPQTNF